MTKQSVNKKIWLSPPHIEGKEELYVKEAFETNWVSPQGPNVNAFESGLENYLGNNAHVVVLSAGTAAIHLALLLAGIEEGDVVLCQSFTFAASANPIVYIKAKPVFIDSERESWNICPELLEKAIKELITSNQRPKALILVHSYGMPAKIDEISLICKKFNIALIEDAAGALGSSYCGMKCGTFGDYGIFSFNGNKIVTTSGGGALVCKTKREKERAVFLASQARVLSPHYQHSEIGYNYRMSNVVAGIGRGQLDYLGKHLVDRRQNHINYKSELKELDGIDFHEETKNARSNYWLTCILTPSFAHRERIRLALERENIESRPLWKPMHLQPVFRKELSFVNGNSENLFEKGLSLPSGSNLGHEDFNRICKCIKENYNDGFE